MIKNKNLPKKEILKIRKKALVEIIIWFVLFAILLIYTLLKKSAYVNNEMEKFVFSLFFISLSIFIVLKFIKNKLIKVSLAVALLLFLFYFLGAYEISPFSKSVCYGDVCGNTEFGPFVKFTLNPLEKVVRSDEKIQEIFRKAYLADGWYSEKLLFIVFTYYLVLSLILIFVIMVVAKLIKKFYNLHIFILFFLSLNICLVSAVTDSNLTNNGKLVNVEVLNTRDLTIEFTQVDSLVENYNQIVENQIHFLNRTYPLADDKFFPDSSQIIYSSGFTNFSTERYCDLTKDLFKFIRITRDFRATDRMIGVVEDGWFALRGRSNTNGLSCGSSIENEVKAVIIEPTVSTVNHLTAHEIGHTYGLCDEYNRTEWDIQNTLSDICPNGDQDDNETLDDQCYPKGCPAETIEPIYRNYFNPPASLTPFFNMMGNGNPWIANDSYNHLLNKFSFPFEFLETDSSILVSGSINKNGSILFDDFYVLNETSINNVTNSNGNYTLMLKIGNEEFYSTKLNPDFNIYFFGGETIVNNISYFAFVVPFNQSVTSISFQNSSGIVIAQRNVSSQTPVVSINSTINGQSFNDAFNVKWNGNDSDGDNLTYSVLLSADGGKNFTTMALDISTTNLTIENSFLENGSQYVVKVFATDGVKTGVATNNVSFSVEPDPIVELISPDHNTALSNNQVLFRYKTEVLNANITNCSLYINNLLNKTNNSAIIQSEILNFSLNLPDGNYNWTVRCIDSRGYIGETEIRNLIISLFIPEIINVTVFPAHQAFGENVTISAVLLNPFNVSVRLNVTNPNGLVTSYAVKNVTNQIWAQNFTDFVNGTYNFTFFVNYSNGLSTEEMGIFDFLVNLVGNCRTLNFSGINYTLIKSIYSPSTCLIIDANNVVVDGKGYIIDGNRTPNTNGIEIVNKQNIIVKNLTVGNFDKGIKNLNIPIDIYYVNSILNIGDGIYLQDTDNLENRPNVLRNINVSFNNGRGLRLLRVSNANITNLFSEGNLDDGIEAEANPSIFVTPRYILLNITIKNNGENGLEFVRNINNTLIRNVLLFNNIKKDLFITTSSIINITNSNISSFSLNHSINNFLLNVTLSTEQISSDSSLTRKWYYRAFTNNATGNVSNANITAYNVTGKYQFNLTTDGTGYTPMTEIVDYINNGGTKTYYSPYTIYASHPSYSTISHERNLTNNIYNDTFTFESPSSCSVLSTPNTFHILQNNIVTTSTCFNITADNVTLNGNGYTITGDGGTSDYGVYSQNRINITIKNLIVANFSRGIYLSYVNMSLVENNTIRNGTLSGLFVDHSNNNTFKDNKGNSNAQEGGAIIWSSWNSIVNNVFNFNLLDGLQITSFSKENIVVNNTIQNNGENGITLSTSDNNRLENNTMTYNGIRGVDIFASNQNNIIGGIINYSGENGIRLAGVSQNNNLTNIKIENTNSSYYDIKFGAETTNGTYLIDMPYVGNYTFFGMGSLVIFKNSNFGEIKFLKTINGSGTNLTNDVMIGNNSVTVRSESNKGLNASANITLYNIGNRGFSSPKVLRDGILCPSSVCYNFTSLTATNVIFNVSSWTNYKIGDYANDTNKLYVQNSSGVKVAWFGSAGNVVLRGTCMNQTSCNNGIANSFKIKNATGSVVAYVNSTGDMCIQGTTSCQNSDQQASCSSPNPSFIITNSTNSEVIVIARTNGNLCLTGYVLENSTP